MSADESHLNLLFAELLCRQPAAPVVHEGLRTRSLSFSLHGVQTAMRKNAPFALHLPYTRAMMAFQLFQPQPAHIVIVGLGGGTLSKYCHRRFPGAIVTTVEIDARVIALRDQFHIPEDSDRFRVVHADAAAWLARMRDAADVLLLDGFDADGLPESLSNQRFYDSCHAALRADGVLVTNLLERGAQASACIGRIGGAFGRQPLCAHVRQGGNPIALAVKNRAPIDWPALHARARDIALSDDLDLRPHVKNMERNHRGVAAPDHPAPVDPVSAVHD